MANDQNTGTSQPYTPPPGVTFDMSTSVPVIPQSQPQSQPYTPPKGVTFDMSTSVPLTPPDQPGVVSRIGSGLWQGAKDVAAPVINSVVSSVKPPADPTEQVLHSAAGEPGLMAYRAAKQVMGTANAVVKAGASEYPQAISDWKNAVSEFHNGNYRNAATSAAEATTDAFGATVPMMAPVAEANRRLIESSRPGGDLAGEAARQAVPAAAVVLTASPEARAAVGDTAEGATSAIQRVNPFRALTSKFTGSNIQPALKAGIQDVWNTVADEAGVARPATKSVQDLGQEVGDAILARSKANYAAIDTATEGRFSGTEQALKAVNQDLRSVTNDAEEAALQVRKTRLEMQMGQIMDEAETKEVSKTTVDAAKADFKQAQAIYDTNHQIRMSTTGVRPDMQGAAEVPEEVNAKSLMNRLNKLYNKTDKSGIGRLQQAVGDDGAADLIGHTATAQKAAKNVARNVTAAKIAGGVIGVPAAGTAVVEGVRKLME